MSMSPRTLRLCLTLLGALLEPLHRGLGFTANLTLNPIPRSRMCKLDLPNDLQLVLVVALPQMCAGQARQEPLY